MLSERRVWCESDTGDVVMVRVESQETDARWCELRVEWQMRELSKCKLNVIGNIDKRFLLIHHVSPYLMKLPILYVFHSFHTSRLFPSSWRFSALFHAYPLSHTCHAPSEPLSHASCGSWCLSHASANIPAP